MSGVHQYLVCINCVFHMQYHMHSDVCITLACKALTLVFRLGVLHTNCNLSWLMENWFKNKSFNSHMSFIFYFPGSLRLRVVFKKFDGKKSWRNKMWRKKKIGRKWAFFSCLDWGKNTRIWMKNLNVDELLESYWCYICNVRFEEVRNFSQTFLTILWGKFYHLFLRIFSPNFPPYFFLCDFL